MSKPSFVNATKAFLQKNSPAILLGVGVALTIGGAVYACVKTRKLDETLKETKDELDFVHEQRKEVEAAEKEEKVEGETAEEQADVITYDDKAYKKDLVKIYGKAGLKLAKLYGIPVLLFVLGLGMIFESHCILGQRYTTALAASLAADKAYNFYRKNVIEEQGVEADQRFRSGLKKTVIEKPVLDESGEPKTKKDGSVQTKKEEVLIPKNEEETLRYSPYARVFSKYVPWMTRSEGECYGSREWEDNGYYNAQFIDGIEHELDRKLQEDGYLFYNDALYALGFDRCPMGQDVGWKVDPDDPLSDDHVKLTIFPKGYSGDSDEVQSLLRNGETDFIIDFNVYGNIRPFVWGKSFRSNNA